ncbi:MAG TPA: AlkA N-terminal domain-containing protein, partial [Acidimicrobiales bacterium]|nr:AlkA N-terminal domain-containing protein [Acidimicrobiales bacterium]
LTLPHDRAVVTLAAGEEGRAPYVAAHLALGDLRDLTAAVGRCRRLLDLDADPETVGGALSGDALLAPLVAARPGLRVPGTVDPAELAVRAILGQQVSVAGARTVGGRLAAAFGEPLAAPEGALTTTFPRAEALAALSPADLPLPAARGRALIGLAEQLSSGKLTLDPGADRDDCEEALLALPGIGPWTAAYIRMRALSDPDAFLAGDLGLRHALAALGEASGPADALRRAEAWRPWRAYALHHLWASLPTTTRPASAAA